MAKRKKVGTVVEPVAQATPLPSNPEALAHLLRTCEKLTEYISPILFREKKRREAWSATLDSNCDLKRVARVLDALGQGSMNSLAVDRPSIEPIIAYLDPAIEAEFAVLYEQRNHWPPFDSANSLSNIGQPELRVLDGHIKAMERILATLHALRERIVERLDKVCDAFYEIPARTYKAVSEDPYLMQLIAMDRAKEYRDRTQLEIAKEVMKGDEGLAKNLLRRAHDKKLLMPRHRKSDKARA